MKAEFTRMGAIELVAEHPAEKILIKDFCHTATAISADDKVEIVAVIGSNMLTGDTTDFTNPAKMTIFIARQPIKEKVDGSRNTVSGS